MTKTAASAIEVRYRATGSGAWSQPRSFGVSDTIAIGSLQRGKSYDFQARSVSYCGARSDWVNVTSVIADADMLPPPVASLTAESVADGVHLGWLFAAAKADTEFSIERSSSATDGFVERTRVKATSYTDPETSGTTYYYRVRAVTTAGGFGGYSNVVSSQGVSVDQLGDDVAAAQAAAAAAKAEADAAQAQLITIASDNILSAGEKPTVIRDYNVITTEQAGIDAQADAYGVDRTAYDDAITTLNNYLTTLTTPVPWNNPSGDTALT